MFLHVAISRYILKILRPDPRPKPMRLSQMICKYISDREHLNLDLSLISVAEVEAFARCKWALNLSDLKERIEKNLD